jgi:hypothetical protein
MVDLLAVHADVLELLSSFRASLAGSPDGKVTHAKDVVSEFTILVYLACSIFLLNWGLRKAFVEPIARTLLGPKADRKKREKFSQSAMEMIFYGVFSLVGYVIVRQQPWIWPSNQWWQVFKTGRETHPFGVDLRAFYLLYAARYLQALASVMLEHRRKDFLEMVLHHAVTLLLLGSSYFSGYVRVGAIIMFILDPADVFLHSAKMCNYIGGRFQVRDPSQREANEFSLRAALRAVLRAASRTN